MSRIFLSHSSKDNLQAVALKQWLADNGWDDVFLDIDTARGLTPGERWKNALTGAAGRCEALLCLLSPYWLDSVECKVEYRHAESLRKRIFAIVIAPCDTKDLPADWQRCELFGDGRQERIRFQFREQPAEVSFLSGGLERLKNGLKKAGVGAEYFPWPPKNRS